MGVDLSTSYLGMELRNPVVVSSCPLTKRLDTLHELEDAGAAAVVLPSLFEEQLDDDQFDTPEAMEPYNRGPEGYLSHLQRAKSELKIPVIASINGVSVGGWVQFARWLSETGADAIELNIYYLPTDPEMTGAAVEERYVEVVRAVREAVSVPLAVKIGPYFSSLPHMAGRLIEAGADGLVLFNRFYQPDIDVSAMEVLPQLTLSSPADLRLPLRWVAILRNQVRCSLATTSGVHTVDDVIKCLLAGSDVAMMASALLEKGIPHLKATLDQLRGWAEREELPNLDEIRGKLSHGKGGEAGDRMERVNYMETLASLTRIP